MSAIEEMEKRVLALPVKQRALLAESLLSSLPPMGEEISEAEELAEAQRREREIESGQVRPLSESEFWKSISSDFRIYRHLPHGIRVTLVRHHRRHPQFGLERR
jgi:hypothetical protein